MSFTVHNVKEEDFSEIYNIFMEVIRKGDSFIYTEDVISVDDIYKRWITNEDSFSYVVKKDLKKIVGSYTIRPNKVGRGSHVCNAAYIVDEAYQGMGIGRLMGQHSLEEAKKSGFKAMQFNVVVSTNLRSVSLWKSLGFKTIGLVPEAFDHAEKGLVGVYIMHRFLD